MPIPWVNDLIIDHDQKVIHLRSLMDDSLGQYGARWNARYV